MMKQSMLTNSVYADFCLSHHVVQPSTSYGSSVVFFMIYEFLV